MIGLLSPPYDYHTAWLSNIHRISECCNLCHWMTAIPLMSPSTVIYSHLVQSPRQSSQNMIVILLIERGKFSTHKAEQQENSVISQSLSAGTKTVELPHRFLRHNCIQKNHDNWWAFEENVNTNWPCCKRPKTYHVQLQTRLFCHLGRVEHWSSAQESHSLVRQCLIAHLHHSSYNREVDIYGCISSTELDH